MSITECQEKLLLLEYVFLLCIFVGSNESYQFHLKLNIFIHTILKIVLLVLDEISYEILVNIKFYQFPAYQSRSNKLDWDRPYTYKAVFQNSLPAENLQFTLRPFYIGRIVNVESIINIMRF